MTGAMKRVVGVFLGLLLTVALMLSVGNWLYDRKIRREVEELFARANRCR